MLSQSKEGGDITVVAVSVFIHDIHRIMGAEQNKFVSPKESLSVVEEFLKMKLIYLKTKIAYSLCY